MTESKTTTNTVDSRALRFMIRELQAAEAPPVDWARVEAGLASRLDQVDRASQPPQIASSLWRVVTFAAAAAAIVLGLASGKGRSALDAHEQARTIDVASSPLAAGEEGARGAHALMSLRAGDAVEANGAAVSYALAGVVEWKLSDGGRVVVDSMGDRGIGHTVRLERGAIHADVTPRDASEGLVEAFVVDVEGTRVAVHGTSFTVTREGDHVVVDVQHGVVAVGAAHHTGATTGHLLVGPSRASFSLDGARTARMLPPIPLEPVATLAPPPATEPAATRVTAPQPAQKPVIIPAKPAATEAETAVEAPKPPVAMLSRATVQATLSQCFKSTFSRPGPQVSFTVASTLHVNIAEDGTPSGGLNPPLNADFTVCVGNAFHGKFPPGTASFDVPFSFSSP